MPVIPIVDVIDLFVVFLLWAFSLAAIAAVYENLEIEFLRAKLARMAWAPVHRTHVRNVTLLGVLLGAAFVTVGVCGYSLWTLLA